MTYPSKNKNFRLFLGGGAIADFAIEGIHEYPNLIELASLFDTARLVCHIASLCRSYSP